MKDLVADMLKEAPAECPTINEVVTRFHDISTALHWWTGNSNNEIQLSYAELDERANALARELVHREDLKVKKGDIVLAFFDKGVEMIVGILGIASHLFHYWFLY